MGRDAHSDSEGIEIEEDKLKESRTLVLPGRTMSAADAGKIPRELTPQGELEIENNEHMCHQAVDPILWVTRAKLCPSVDPI